MIYRCTYQDDDAWERFKRIVHERSQELIQTSDTPEVADSLEWTLVEDRVPLDGASRSQLRERFNTWAAEAIPIEQLRAEAEIERTLEPSFGIPRYVYFVQVDEEALQSVIAAPKPDLLGEGFINFVDSR